MLPIFPPSQFLPFFAFLYYQNLKCSINASYRVHVLCTSFNCTVGAVGSCRQYTHTLTQKAALSLLFLLDSCLLAGCCFDTNNNSNNRNDLSKSCSATATLTSHIGNNQQTQTKRLSHYRYKLRANLSGTLDI